MVKSDDSDLEGLYKVEEERVGVPVKGGLYEVCDTFSSVYSITAHVVAVFIDCPNMYESLGNRIGCTFMLSFSTQCY